MKKAINLMLKNLFFLLTATCFYINAVAQDSSASSATQSTTTTTVTNWYLQPWVWIVAGAVFIIILVALLRGNNNTDKLTVTKTVSRD